MLEVLQSFISVFLCALGPSPGDGFFLHVRFTGCCSSSPPYSVSFIDQFLQDFCHFCVYFNVFSDVVLNMELSYLMVSSVVGFYSSPFFTGILPRAKDTNLTQVPDDHTLHICSLLRIRADFILNLVSDHCKLHVTAHPQLGASSLFTHNW